MAFLGVYRVFFFFFKDVTVMMNEWTNTSKHLMCFYMARIKCLSLILLSVVVSVPGPFWRPSKVIASSQCPNTASGSTRQLPGRCYGQYFMFYFPRSHPTPPSLSPTNLLSRAKLSTMECSHHMDGWPLCARLWALSKISPESNSVPATKSCLDETINWGLPCLYACKKITYTC